MTREEHIENLKAIASDMPSDKCADWIESLMAGVKALEQEPCDDAISREATVERLCKIAEIMNKKRDGLGSPYVMAALFIQDNKDEFPPVTAQPNMGYISIDDVMAVFDNFMRGDVDENDTETFLEMLKDKAEGSEE